jgi:hypothetical protein
MFWPKNSVIESVDVFKRRMLNVSRFCQHSALRRLIVSFESRGFADRLDANRTMERV